MQTCQIERVTVFVATFKDDVSTATPTPERLRPVALEEGDRSQEPGISQEPEAAEQGRIGGRESASQMVARMLSEPSSAPSAPASVTSSSSAAPLSHPLRSPSLQSMEQPGPVEPREMGAPCETDLLQVGQYAVDFLD